MCRLGRVCLMYFGQCDCYDGGMADDARHGDAVVINYLSLVIH